MKKENNIALIWDVLLHFMYPQEYAESLAEFLKKKKAHSILDASCGTGFPSIELAKKGFNVIGADADEKMLERAKQKSVEQCAKLEFMKVDWTKLSKTFTQKFDCVMCRGNSLPYAASWGKESLDIPIARKKIEKAVENFYAVLKKGGICYIDAAPKVDFLPNHKKEVIFDPLVIDGKSVRMIQRIYHDNKKHIRHWKPIVEITANGKTKTMWKKYKGYHLGHDILVSLMKKAGFCKVDEYVEIKGEKNYDVFVGYKK
ncbi:MAG: class I SAM-dependent methyltransferase [Candidatus Diapherotrites archaeon]